MFAIFTVEFATGISGIGSSLFGMPPIPQIPSTTASSSLSTSGKFMASVVRPNFQGASSNIFGKQASEMTTGPNPTSQGIFGKPAPLSTFSPAFATNTKHSGNDDISAIVKPQASNIFAIKRPTDTKLTTQGNIFLTPSSKVETHITTKPVEPDLFTSALRTMDKQTAFGVIPESTQSSPLFEKATVKAPLTNIFAAPKSNASLFGVFTGSATSGSSSSNKGIFGIPTSGRSSEGQPQKSNPFARPSAPQVFGDTSKVFKRNESNILPDSNTSQVLKDKGKVGIKDRLGIKRTLNRDGVDTYSQIQSPNASTLVTVSATSSECGSESSDNTVDISPSSGGAKKFERLASKEELMEIKSIICEQVPSIALNEGIMGKHFSKFGEVTKMYFNPKKQTAIIHFTDHKSAKKAKEKGHLISNKIPSIEAIFYHRKNRSRKSSEMENKGSKAIRRDYPTSEGEDIKDELSTMAESASGDLLFESETSASGRDDVFAGAKKRKGTLVKAAGTKKSSVNPELGEAVVSTPAPLAPVIKPTVTKSEILSKMQVQAMDDLDRYNILETRDRYMKEFLPKIEQRALKGSCPDICPEKERYSRSAKNQLRLYEKIDGIIHHKAVVKEYSRSAADASIPLSHELRPGHILKQTMDHLLCNVVDRIDVMGSCGSMEDWYADVEQNGGQTDISPTSATQNNENVGDWFEFLWSVTRGIRKDITQQELTDLAAVDLVEKCARFHIMCAERLVEEDSHQFAKKLNDENLTKCIQTLKHMYYDLMLDGTICPNEPEFRSYEVLLNMNDGDTLRRVQNLDPWVRQSSEISFSLKIMSSLYNNNYVKFFKLVGEATLLQGCILLRYFHQVRRKALDTMTKAFCSARSVTQFSLSKVMYILGFEDLLSCAKYCGLHGMEYEIESDILFMDRSTFSYPMETPNMQRAINLIESKRQVKWSAVVNGGPLPSYNPYISYEPHNSFDDNGYLKREAYEAKDQILAKEDGTRSYEELQQRQDKLKSQDLAAKDIVKDLVEDVSNDIIHQVSSGSIESMHSSEAATEIVEEIAKDITEEMAQLVALEAIKDAQNIELQRRIKKEEMMDAAEDVSKDIIDEVSLEIIKQVSENELKEYEQNLKLQRQISMAPSIWEDICKDVLDIELLSIAQTAIKEAAAHRDSVVEDMKQRGLKKLQNKIFNAWRHYVMKVQKQKNTLANFPSTPSFKSVAAQADLLSWGNQNDEKPHSSKSLKNRIDNRRLLGNLFKTVDLEEEFLNTLVLKKIELHKEVGKYLTKANPTTANVSWKLIICLPDTSYESKNRAICEMIKRKFSGDKTSSNVCDDLNLLLCESVPYHESDGPLNILSPSKRRLCSICVRSVTTQVLVEEIAMSEKKRRDILSGTSAILFLDIESDANDDANDDDQSIDEDNPLARLESLLHNIPHNPPVPMLVMTTSRESLDDVATKLDLETWMHQKFIRTYHINRVSINIFNLESLVNIERSIVWLAENSPPSNYPVVSFLHKREAKTNQLLVKPITHFVQDFLSENMYTNIYNDLEDRRLQGYAHQRPNTLIALFNSAIEHLIKLVKNPELQEVSWPIPELKSALVYGCREVVPSYWNETGYIDEICETLKSLALPNFNDDIRYHLFRSLFKRKSI